MNTHTRFSLPSSVRSVLVGVAVGVVIATGLLLLCALLIYRLDLPDGAVTPMALIAIGLGALVGGAVAGLCHKQKGLLIVPGDDFGCPDYFRMCYCVEHDRILRSLPLFRELAADL